MIHLKTYAQLHESDVAYTAIPGITRRFNGVDLKCEYRSEITKPDLVEFWVTVFPSKNDLARMGIWSESFSQHPETGVNIYYAVKVFEEESDFEDWGIDSVRELTSDDVIDMFEEGMKKALKWELTPEETLATVQSADFRTDWVLLPPDRAQAYKLLTGIGGI